MEDDVILNRPSDRRIIGDDNNLPPGPPGTENDTIELDQKKSKSKKEKDTRRSSSPLSRSRDNRSSSSRGGGGGKVRSPPSRGKSPSPRGRRTPSPPTRRNRRSISKGRDRRRSTSRKRETPSYGRNYSPPPNRRRFGGGGRMYHSRDRRRSPIRRDLMDRRRDRRSRSRDRYRGRRTPPSRSRSPSPRSHRWSPIGKKPASPPVPPPPTVTPVQMPVVPGPPQFGVPPPNVYSDAYAGYPPPHQYQPPPQYQPNDYAPGPMAPPPQFAPAYPPPPAWGVVPTEDFTQQSPVTWAHAAPVPPPQQPVTVTPIESEEDQQKREAAVAQEVQNQREQLRKQRNDYLKRAAAHKRELKILKEQRSLLVSGNGSLSPTTKGFLDENDTLQSQIQKKMTTIENVIDMLNGIIGDDNPPSSSSSLSPASLSTITPITKSSKLSSSSLSLLKQAGGNSTLLSKKGSSIGGGRISDHQNDDEDDDDDSSPERLKTKLIESMNKKRSNMDELSRKDNEKDKIRIKEKDHHHHQQRNRSRSLEKKPEIKIKEEHIEKKSDDIYSAGRKINYIFYDPEMHWCQNCDVFPKTAKDYLNHLHSQQHKDNIDTADTPWHDHMINDDFPNYQSSSTKRAPIRGLQFFVPASAWYCKLCNFWMGDLHCASAHLKSQTHSEKYSKFFEQNPHFEMDWMADRQRIYDNLRAPPPPPQITSVSTTGLDLLESIPLQINTTQKSINENEKHSAVKKRKKKSDEKRDKKKKRRTKKRKKAESSSSSSSASSSTSSSSSSSSSSESDLDENVNKNGSKVKKSVTTKETIKHDLEANAHSIRVAMRNLTKTQESYGADSDSVRGKWTTIRESQIASIEPVPPPPPRIVTPPAVDLETKKKDELMMSQWNAPVQPIISESEKKLLEELKGKLKSRPIDEQKKKDSSGKSDSKRKDDKDRRSKSKERKDRSRSRDRRDRRSRDRRSRSRDKRRSSRERRISRSPKDTRNRRRGSISRRKRSRSPRRRSRSQSNRHGRRRSYSRSHSRSRSRSVSKSHTNTPRSRSKSADHRVEKPVVRYPEFRPRIPPENKKVSKVKTEEESERKKSPKDTTKKKDQMSVSDKKKLPFIGRMPVFKKQKEGENDKKESENENQENSENSVSSNQHQQKQQQQQQQQQHRQQQQQKSQIQIPQLQSLQQHQQVEQIQMNYDQHYYDYEDLMPDPMQYVTLMGAPPPPPSEPPPDENDDDDEKDILPPGVDETETDLIPKPISDAPIPKTGPLPKDFEEALNIIFPGENKTSEDEADINEITNNKAQIENKTIIGDEISNKNEMNIGETIEIATTTTTTTDVGVPPTMMLDTIDETSQISLGYAQDIQQEMIIGGGGVPVPIAVPIAVPVTTDISYMPSSIPPPVAPPPNHVVDIYNEQEMNFEYLTMRTEIGGGGGKDSSPTNSEKIRRQEELDDLAMLGIDADDLAAQCM